MKLRYKKITIFFFLLISMSLAVFIGCNSGNTSNNGDGFKGTEFVGTDSNSGSLEIDLKETEIPVGDIAGFEVFLKDKDGEPAPNIQVICDTELGLALVEPTTGKEITSGTGQISGKLGCSRPGSLVVGCRIATGSVRKFETVKCTGLVPPGFTGFPGAGGGTLGGGVLSPDNGGPGASPDLIRITSFSVTSVGTVGANSTSIDTSRCACQVPSSSTPQPPTAEPFTDDILTVNMKNDSSSPFRPQTVRFSVSGVGSSSTFSVSTEIAPNSAGTFSLLLFDATTSGRKKIPTSGAILPLEAGVRNIQVTVSGVDLAGNSVETTSSFSINFDQYNVCAAGNCI